MQNGDTDIEVPNMNGLMDTVKERLEKLTQRYFLSVTLPRKNISHE